VVWEGFLAGFGGRLWLLLTLAFYAASLLALYHYGLARTLGVKDYISDECWYVSSAVNVARKVLGLHFTPRVNSSVAAYTIVYNSTLCSLDDVIGLLSRGLPSFSVARLYSKISAVAVYVPLAYAERVGALQRYDCIVDVVPGVMPDSENINLYLNTEHPPLVKLLFALLLYARGFSFATLRALSFAFAAAGLAAVYAAVYWALRRWGLEAVPALVLPLTVVLFDRSIQSMSAVAMLDVYAASLDAVAVVLLLYGRPLASSIVLGLAGAAKYTGLFPLPAPVVYSHLRGDGWGRKLLLAATPLIIVGLSWLPFFARYGVGWTVREVVSALEWHTSSRPPGGPPPTDPVGLLLGRPGFTLYYVDDTPYLVAASNPGVTIPALVIAVLAAVGVAVARCNGLSIVSRGSAAGVLSAALALVSAVLGYAAVWAAGNHTLYNFYSVQLSMLSALILPLYPLTLKLRPALGRSAVGGCLLERGGAGWLYAIAVFFAVPLSAALFNPPLARASGMQPLYSMITLPPGKLELLALIGTAMVAYAAAALKTSSRNPPGTAGLLAAQLASWTIAGLASLASVEAALAPLALVAALQPTVLDALVLGLILPAYTSCIIASRTRKLPESLKLLAVFTAATSAAYALAWLAHAPATPRALAAAVLGLACTPAPWQAAAALLPAVNPTLAPLLTLAPQNVMGETILRTYATGVLAAYLTLARLGYTLHAGLLVRTAAVLEAAAIAYTSMKRGAAARERDGETGQDAASPPRP
jgi:predicted membrane-bound dolichyl-phosphate-mannose-protein mannosyltransferase